MTTMPATSSTNSSSQPFAHALRRLYLARFAFAVVWAGLLFTTADTTGPGLTSLLVVYPLFDAAAVTWQLRARTGSTAPETAARVNIVVSVAVAIALGVASTVSLDAALVVWGAWAVGAGVPQLVTAIRNRTTGGQVAQMLSGGISVVAGASFLAQGLRGTDSLAGVGGYAVVGGVFFLISALRLGAVLRTRDVR